MRRNRHKIVAATIVLLVLPSILYLSAQEEEEILREEAFIMGYAHTWGESPVNYNPFVPAVSYGVGLREPFFSVQDSAGAEWPVLGTSYEWVGDDYTKWVLHLNPDATWNDGEPFTADDVVFTVNLLKENPDLSHAMEVQPIESVQALDDHTVEFNLIGSRPRFNFRAVDFIVPEHIWKDVDPITFPNFPDPVFTGPYELYSATEELIITRRRDDYWGELPAPKWLIQKTVYGEETATEELLGHNIEYYHEFTYETVDYVLETNPHAQVMWEPDGCGTGIIFNNLHYPFNITEFRWALSYAFDRNKVRDLCWGSKSPLAAVPFTNKERIMKWVDWDVVEQYNVLEYPDGNPELAIQMLEDLGFDRDTEGFFTYPGENNTRLHFRILNSPKEWPMWYCLGFAIEDDLAAIGIESTVEVYLASVFVDMWEARDHDMCAHAHSCASEPYDFFITQTTDYPTGGWYGNNEGYSNPELDALVAQLELLPEDPTNPEAWDLSSRLLGIWLRDLPSAPISVHQYPAVYDTYYWTGFPTEEDFYADPVSPTSFVMLARVEPTGRLPPGIVTDPLFGRTTETIRNTYYASIGVVVVVVVAVAGWYTRRKS